jgi:hypothetical protein
VRSFAHWTPRYLLDRTALWFYERSHSRHPWLTPQANRVIATLLGRGGRGLEWGSGRSTLWLGKQLAQLTSVESNREWYARVERALRRADLRNVDLRFAPIDSREAGETTRYVSVALDLPDESLEFVLIDGDLRDHCALAVLPKVAPGGVLVLDDAHRYLDRTTRSPASRSGRGPLNEHWAMFEHKVAGWRSIWTTSGVTDTALWIRPKALS